MLMMKDLILDISSSRSSIFKNKRNNSVAKKRKFKTMMDDFLSRVLGVGKPKVAYDPEPPNEEEDSDNKQYDSE